MDPKNKKNVTCLNRQDEAKGTEVTCYQIIPDRNCEGNYEIENCSTSKIHNMPVHEEYKLKVARSEFNSNVNSLLKESLEDLEFSKANDLHQCAQRELFFEQTERLIGDYKTKFADYCERTNKFLDESRRQLEILNNDGEVINRETTKIVNELSEMLIL